MKALRKFIKIICIIFILSYFCTLKSYAGDITVNNVWNYSLNDLVKKYHTIDQNGIWKNAGYNSCSQANSDKGYSDHIVGAYETLYDKKTGTIVANSVSQESGQTFSKSSGKDIRNFAAAMSLNQNIQGVRAALMRCIKNGRLSSSETLASNNYDGSTYGGSSSAWEAENQKLRDKYKHYHQLEEVDVSSKPEGKEVNIDGTDYVQMGPFKMKFGTSKLSDMTINGTSVFGQGIAKYRIAGENTVRKHFNETKPGETNAYVLNNKKFYVLVSKSKLKTITGNTSTVNIKFKQSDFSYEKGRAIICNDYNSEQGNIWYIHKTDTVKGGEVGFKVKLTDNIDIVVNKVWDDKNSKSRPSSVKVTISAGGAVINAAGKTSLTKKITSSGTVTFSDLKKTDDDGNLLVYTIEEEVPDGYTASYTAKTLKIKEGKSIYTTTITNKKDGEDIEIDTDTDVGDLLITKEGGDMSFRVWEDSPAQWISSEETGSGSQDYYWPSDEYNGGAVTSSALEEKNEIDSGKKVGSYTYKTYYDISEHEVWKPVYKWVDKKDSDGNTVYENKTDSEGNIVYEKDGVTPVKVPVQVREFDHNEYDYSWYSYSYKIIKNNCVHKKTRDWLGSYKTINGQYKISGLYPGTYEIYETECDEYYDLELQEGYSEIGYHDVPKIRFAASASLAENKSETIKLGMPSNVDVYNERTRADLEIEKTYETGEPIDDVQIAIYGEVNEGEYNYSGWLTTDGSYESVKWNAISSIFTGSPSDPYITEDGKILITGLPVGTYKIYEVKTKSIEYALEGQGTYEGGKTLLGTVTIARDTYSTVQASYVQKKRPKGDITIDKTGVYVNNQLSNPNVTEKLANVSFILSSKATDLGGWKNGTYVYIRANEKGEDIVDFTEDKGEATIFTTDSEGRVTIPGLYEDLGPYEIEEIENEEQDKYYTDPIVVRGDTTANAPSTALIINPRSSGDLKIEKVDENYHDLKLSGGKFKIKLVSAEYAAVSNMWLGDNGFDHLAEGNTYDYYDSKSNEYLVSDVSNAMEFETDSNGEINIKKIINGTYEVYETKTPRGYDITRQDGYDPSTGMVYRGTVTIATNDNVINYQVVNKKVVNKLDGYVWVDEKDTKANSYNSLYKDNNGEKDYLKEGIQVNLIDKNTGKTMASTVTDKNGYYEFTTYSDGSDIIYWDLAHSYVEYIYNNKIIYTDDTKKDVKEYGFIVANPFVGGQSKITINSKAQAKEITKDELLDDNLTGTDNPYPGRAVTYTSASELGFSEILKQNAEVTPNDGKQNNDDSKNTSAFLEDKLITSYYDEDRFTIDNINLGLVEKNPTTHAIDESIEYVKIVKGNYTFKYEYGEKAITEEGQEQAAPTVKFQNSKKTFTQNIYPSDIKYNAANNSKFEIDDGEKFKVYVVYKIDIQNTTTINNEDLYVEQGLYLNKLENTYDSSRFQISGDKLAGDDDNIADDFKLWSDSSDSGDNKTASFNIDDSNKAYKRGNEGIKPNKIESTYIQYKVTDEALNSWLDKKIKNNESTFKAAPTVSTSYAYHIYTRKDKNWKDKDTYTHETIQEKREDGALSLKWHILEPRTISGTVFEDSKDESRADERVGDGKYNNGEKNLTDVRVSLIDADSEDGRVAPLYDGNFSQNTETGKWTSDKQLGSVTVNENGYYELIGVVPGRYYLQFTYGNGTVKYKDLNGNEITERDQIKTTIKGKPEPIKSNYYKSTIITGSAKGAKDDNASTWFLGDIQVGVNSVASDYTGTYYDANGNVVGEENTNMINSRTTSDKELNYTTSQDKVVINARTPLMDVQFEDHNDIKISHNDVPTLPEVCSGMNFGIMERPRIDISLDKEIKNIKLTLHNGTTLINGNPSEQNVSSLAAMSKSYAKIELPSDKLFGSDLTITYKLIATNDSEIDYATEDYYKYGDFDNTVSPVTTTVTKIVDYLSYNECDYKNPDQVNIDDIVDEGTNGCDNTIYFKPEVNEAEVNKKYKKKYILTSSDKKLRPSKADNSDNKGNSKAEYIVTVNRLVGDSDDDAGVNNFSEIIGITNVTFSPQYYSTSGSFIIEDEGTSEDDNTGATIAVTPPTGENRSYTMYIVAGISLIVIAGGVILIKKFVL